MSKFVLGNTAPESTASAAKQLLGATAAAPRAASAGSQEPTVAWLNLELVDRNGGKHKLRRGVPLSTKNNVEISLLKAMGVTDVSFDAAGNPVFHGAQMLEDGTKEFNLVGSITLTRAPVDIEL